MLHESKFSFGGVGGRGGEGKGFGPLFLNFLDPPLQTLIIRCYIVFLVWFIKRAWAACDFAWLNRFL